MQPLATSSETPVAAVPARALVTSDRSTSLHGSNNRKRRVSTPASSGHVFTGSPLQQHEARHVTPSTTEADADNDGSTALARWRLTHSSRSQQQQQQQRPRSEHLLQHARESRGGSSRSAASVATTSTTAAAGLASIAHDARRSTATDPRRAFHAYEPFPTQRYAFVREYEPPHARNSNSRCPTSGGLKHQVLHTVVARDCNDSQLVVLTCLAKSIVTERQVDHALRVAQTLARKAGFQALLRVWDADKNWVFVQAFDAAWTSVASGLDVASATTTTSSSSFAEEKLRDVVFQVVALVHFLHAHDLSLAGELWPHDLMVKDGKVALLFSVPFVLSGYTLVAANDRNRAADIAAIGMLLFQLCMAPFAPPSGSDVASLDLASVELAIEDQLSHVSAPCRDLLFDCLAAKLTIDELSKRKWLRHVDFISIASKLEPCASSAHMRRLLYKSLLWKLAAFFLTDWLDHVHGVAALPSSAAGVEDEELRQKLRQKASKRTVVGRKLLLLTGHSPHWLKRGAAILPPLGSTILPHRDSDSSNGAVATQQLESVFQTWTSDEVVPTASASGSGYSEFAYDFASLAGASSDRLYDAFEWVETDDHDVDISDGQDCTSAASSDVAALAAAKRERRLSIGLMHDDVAAHALQHETLRSLQTSGSHDSNSSSHDSQSFTPGAASGATSGSTDAVHFSAFAPPDAAARDRIRVDIWAYLRQQRDAMLETAREQSDVEVAQHVAPFHVQRGALVTVVLEPSARFAVLGDDCKTFRWRGAISGVSFALVRKPLPTTTRIPTTYDDDNHDSSDSDNELCIARIIAGTKVSLLFIRLRSGDTGGRDRTASRDAATSDIDSGFALLESRLEHVHAAVRAIPSRELELLRPVGRGAFGDALLARWCDTTDVVVKVLHRDAFRSSDAAATLEHEAAVMHLLGKHPHVVELLGVCGDWASSAGAPALVTEYLPNGSLEDVLHGSAAATPAAIDSDRNDSYALLYDSAKSSTSGSSSSSASAPPTFGLFARTVMARDAAHGLANIHMGHVLHCDVAARNCLVDAHFRVKVCDFGLARALRGPPRSATASSIDSSAATLAGSVFAFDDSARRGFGPLKWMAPESVLPPHVYSMQSDSYMFGVLLYEIFAGARPFPELSARDALALIAEGKHVPIPIGLPPAHEALMRRCFALHPLQRPTMDQIYATLDSWILHDTRTHAVATPF